MNILRKTAPLLLVLTIIVFLMSSCRSGNQETSLSTEDTTNAALQDTVVNDVNSTDTTLNGEQAQTTVNQPKTALSTVLIYNFHVTNRCPSCIAIENATTKTINTYFSKELKQGRIKRQVLNVDDQANSQIAEKYQVFGSGIFVTRVYKGKETTTDLTGDGFKYAKNKEEKFIEILKNKIIEYLK